VITVTLLLLGRTRPLTLILNDFVHSLIEYRIQTTQAEVFRAVSRLILAIASITESSTLTIMAWELLDEGMLWIGLCKEHDLTKILLLWSLYWCHRHNHWSDWLVNGWHWLCSDRCHYGWVVIINETLLEINSLKCYLLAGGTLHWLCTLLEYCLRVLSSGTFLLLHLNFRLD
jgi:hypothetical protein